MIKTIETERGPLPNVEKSAFCKGEYVGYGRGECWAIVRINSAAGMWQASVPRDHKIPLIFGRTLADISAKLAEPVTCAGFNHAMTWYGFATADAAEYDRNGSPNVARSYRYRATLHLMNAIGFASL